MQVQSSLGAVAAYSVCECDSLDLSPDGFPSG